MKKEEKIKKAILSNKNLLKNIVASVYADTQEEAINYFIDNAQRYIKAIKEERVICNIISVSKSGMSRRLEFKEFSYDTKQKRGFLYQFHVFFKCLGYKNNGNGFLINGCGMDMVFHTNYTIINQLYHLGFIDKDTCNILAQKKPKSV